MKQARAPIATASKIFAHYDQADDDGLIGVGGDLSPEMLYEAYTHAIFPWPQQNLPLLWFCPDPRGILHLEDVHFSKSDLKNFKKMDVTLSMDHAFEAVIRRCAEIKRSHQSGTWITEEMINGYLKFHELGFAHSVECWLGSRLVGGLYFVLCEGVVSAESMFYEEPHASKRCVYELVQWCKAQKIEWIDCQMVTPITERLGARYIARDQYLQWVKESQLKRLKLKNA